jgi:hypothetical protein
MTITIEKVSASSSDYEKSKDDLGKVLKRYFEFDHREANGCVCRK